jgi:hypothetical protein
MMKISRADQKSKTKNRLEAVLLEALREGPQEEATPEWWATLNGEIVSHAAARKAENKS